MAIKKGPTKGSGGKHRNALRGKGPTPKAEDRVYHKAYKAKQATNRRKMADPRLAARRRAAKFTSDSDDLVIGRNAVLEALRVGVPSMQLYIATRIEHDDRTREIIKLAGAQSLHLLEADRLEMDRIARSSNHQGVVLKVQPYQYSSLAELADIAESGAEEAERGHGTADGKNAHRAQSRAGQRAGKETGQPEKCAGQHGGDRVAIHKVSSLSLFYNNRIWHAAAIRQSKNPTKIFAGFLAF